MLEKIKYIFVLKYGNTAKKIEYIKKCKNENTIIEIFNSLSLEEKMELLKSNISKDKLFKIIEHIKQNDFYSILSNYPDLALQIDPNALYKFFNKLASKEILNFLDKSNPFGIKLFAVLRRNKEELNILFSKLDIPDKIEFLRNYKFDINENSKKELINYLNQADHIISLNQINLYSDIFDIILKKGLGIDILLTIMNKSFFEKLNNIIGLQPYMLFKYFANDERFYSLINNINGNYEIFLRIIKSIYAKYEKYSIIKKGEILFKITDFINKYPDLANDLLINAPIEDNKFQLLFLLNNKRTFEITSCKELVKVDEYVKKDIANIIENENVNNIRELYIKTLYGNELANYNLKVNFKSLQNIYNKHLSDEIDEIINEILPIIKDIEEIHKITNIDEIKVRLENINYEKLKKDYCKSEMLIENLRTIYKIDTIESLTNISKLPKDIMKVDERTNCVYYDLSECEYGLLVHVSNADPKNLIEPKIVGFNHISLTPIGNQGKNIYQFIDNGIIYGFSEIPENNFIFNSVKNSNSNLVGENSLNYTNANNTVYYPEDFETTCYESINRETPETNIIRDGLVPTCIIMCGEVPTQKEIEAKEILEKYLKKEIRIIKTQKNLTRIDEIKYTKQELILQFIKEEKDSLLNFSNEVLSQNEYDVLETHKRK